MKIICVIPARAESSRFFEKPLAMILVADFFAAGSERSVKAHECGPVLQSVTAFVRPLVGYEPRNGLFAFVFCERKKVIKRYYGHLADSIVETLKLLSISDKELKEKVEFHGFEQLLQCQLPDRTGRRE